MRSRPLSRPHFLPFRAEGTAISALQAGVGLDLGNLLAQVCPLAAVSKGSATPSTPTPNQHLPAATTPAQPSHPAFSLLSLVTSRCPRAAARTTFRAHGCRCEHGVVRIHAGCVCPSAPEDTGSQVHCVQAGLWESWCREVTRPVARPSHGRQGAGLTVQSQWEQGTATRPPVPSSRLTNLNHAGLQAPAQPKDCGKATQLHCRGACGPIEA